MILQRYDEWASAREEVLTVEGETGYLDETAIQGLDDDACDLAHDLATTLREVLATLAALVDTVEAVAAEYTDDEVIDRQALQDARVTLENLTTPE